jgi:O-antigen ligase
MHNFLDRLPKSTDERTVIWKTGIDTFLSNPMGTGIGPGGFGEAGFVSGGYWGVGRRISLHSDYLSFLVERGVLGFAGLIIFLVAVALTARRCLRTARSEREMLWACGLIAMFLFILIDAGSHEVMHYRHVWLAFGLLAAQAKIQGRALAQSAPGWAFQRPELRPDLRPGLARPVPRLNRPAR